MPPLQFVLFKGTFVLFRNDQCCLLVLELEGPVTIHSHPGYPSSRLPTCNPHSLPAEVTSQTTPQSPMSSAWAPIHHLFFCLPWCLGPHRQAATCLVEGKVSSAKMQLSLECADQVLSAILTLARDACKEWATEWVRCWAAPRFFLASEETSAVFRAFA